MSANLNFDGINKNMMNVSQRSKPKRMEIILSIILLIVLLTSYGCSGRVEGNFVRKDAGIDKTCPEDVTDIDGNPYTTVRIDDQCWMAENLKTTRYAGGSIIKEAYVVDGDENNAVMWGRVYTWHAVSKPAGICPTGWRVASDEDYQKLEITMGMNPKTAEETGWRQTGNESRKKNMIMHIPGLPLKNNRSTAPGFRPCLPELAPNLWELCWTYRCLWRLLDGQRV
jgi:hypothetical protein